VTQFSTEWSFDVLSAAKCFKCGRFRKDFGEMHCTGSHCNYSDSCCQQCSLKSSKTSWCVACRSIQTFVFRKSKVAEALIGSQKVHCPKFSEGCKAVGFIKDGFPESHESFCKYKTVTCICGETMRAPIAFKHAEVCAKSMEE
jgi:hypothetical protein